MTEAQWKEYYENYQRKQFGTVPGTRVREVSVKTDNSAYKSNDRIP